ncbi:hypothetical protein GGI21_006470, partial [Coemansia aciculifera]
YHQGDQVHYGAPFQTMHIQPNFGQFVPPQPTANGHPQHPQQQQQQLPAQDFQSCQ